MKICIFSDGNFKTVFFTFKDENIQSRCNFFGGDQFFRLFVSQKSKICFYIIKYGASYNANLMVFFHKKIFFSPQMQQ